MPTPKFNENAEWIKKFPKDIVCMFLERYVSRTNSVFKLYYRCRSLRIIIPRVFNKYFFKSRTKIDVFNINDYCIDETLKAEFRFLLETIKDIHNRDRHSDGTSKYKSQGVRRTITIEVFNTCLNLIEKLRLYDLLFDATTKNVGSLSCVQSREIHEILHALEMRADSRAETRADSRAESRADSRAETRADSRAETRADSRAETRADSRAETRAYVTYYTEPDDHQMCRGCTVLHALNEIVTGGDHDCCGKHCTENLNPPVDQLHTLKLMQELSEKLVKSFVGIDHLSTDMNTDFNSRDDIIYRHDEFAKKILKTVSRNIINAHIFIDHMFMESHAGFDPVSIGSLPPYRQREERKSILGSFSNLIDPIQSVLKESVKMPGNQARCSGSDEEEDEESDEDTDSDSTFDELDTPSCDSNTSYYSSDIAIKLEYLTRSTTINESGLVDWNLVKERFNNRYNTQYSIENLQGTLKTYRQSKTKNMDHCFHGAAEQVVISFAYKLAGKQMAYLLFLNEMCAIRQRVVMNISNILETNLIGKLLHKHATKLCKRAVASYIKVVKSYI